MAWPCWSTLSNNYSTSSRDPRHRCLVAYSNRFTTNWLGKTHHHHQKRRRDSTKKAFPKVNRNARRFCLFDAFRALVDRPKSVRLSKLRLLSLARVIAR